MNYFYIYNLINLTPKHLLGVPKKTEASLSTLSFIKTFLIGGFFEINLYYCLNLTSIKGNPHWFTIIYRFLKKVFYLKNFQSYGNQNSQQVFCKRQKVCIFVSLFLLKIEHSFFQESMNNKKLTGVTIYRCQIQAIIKKRKTFQVLKLIYFKKPPHQKSSNKA